MNDILSLLKTLRRPRLLIRAARLGQADYNRTRDLRRVMKTSELPTPGRAILSLINREAQIEEARKNGDASYSIAQHVDVLVAMMGEARLLVLARGA